MINVAFKLSMGNIHTSFLQKMRENWKSYRLTGQALGCLVVDSVQLKAFPDVSDFPLNAIYV